MIDKKADARPSIHNVAAYAGVSIATVSKVMQGVATVRKENVIAVQNAIEALGYRINPLGAELRRGQRKLVGAIVADYRNKESAHLLSALETSVESRGYTLMVASSRGSEDREAELVGRMQDWRVAGLIVESASGREKASLLLQDGPPVVFLDNNTAEGLHDLVLDDVAAALDHATRMAGRRSRSVFLSGRVDNKHVKDAIEGAGDCLVRNLADLDTSGPIFVVANAEEARSFCQMVDENVVLRTTFLQSDIDGISSAAVARLFDRLVNPEAAKDVQKVAMRVSHGPQL